MLAMNDDQKSVMIAISVGLIDLVKYHENKENPKSARSRELAKLIDAELKLIDYYRINVMPHEKLAIASQVLDEVENLIKSRFPKGEV